MSERHIKISLSVKEERARSFSELRTLFKKTAQKKKYTGSGETPKEKKEERKRTERKEERKRTERKEERKRTERKEERKRTERKEERKRYCGYGINFSVTKLENIATTENDERKQEKRDWK
ncbi:hypothetical protein EV360DRAFT_71101 [Lentinula raphanica]|nr:hypothetical protein EV360DRAFT_71101 [Lentinula raphanica]